MLDLVVWKEKRDGDSQGNLKVELSLNHYYFTSLFILCFKCSLYLYVNKNYPPPFIEQVLAWEFSLKF